MNKNSTVHLPFKGFSLAGKLSKLREEKDRKRRKKAVIVGISIILAILFVIFGLQCAYKILAHFLF